MEEHSFDRAAARAYILNCFIEQGDFLMFGEETVGKMLERTQELDEAFMQKSGVNDGAFYDDDEAFTFMHEKLTEVFPEHKMYTMRFVEDYMDYMERYLDSIGAIEWE